jgi:hypothetical protein
MAVLLTKVVKTYEVVTKTEAENLIKEVEAKSEGVITYKLSHRTKKSGGEVQYEWYVVEITQKIKE